MATGAMKLIYLTLGIMFLALGVIGLLLPILPGVLFLAGAVYMLSRVSHRVRQFAEDNPTPREMARSAIIGARNIARGVSRLFA